MTPAFDIGLAISAIAIADRHVRDFQMESTGAEEEIEIAERIEVAEMRAIRRDPLVIFFEKNFRSAKRVFDRLAERPTEGETEEFVGDEIAEAHRLVLASDKQGGRRWRNRRDRKRARDKISAVLPAASSGRHRGSSESRHVAAAKPSRTALPLPLASFAAAL